MTQPPSSLHAALSPLPEPTPAWRTAHDVHFAHDEGSLLSSVTRFILEGVRAGQPIVVIATPSHRKHLEDAVRSIIPNAFEHGDFAWVDARETLAAVMEGSLPSAEMFAATIGNVFERVMATRQYLVIRAYGEMVDLLWKAGNIDGAIALERLWNGLAAKYSFNLLCTYSMSASLKESHNDAYRRICAQHGGISP